jgi:hypothetical protein
MYGRVVLLCTEEVSSHVLHGWVLLGGVHLGICVDSPFQISCEFLHL